MTWRPLDTLGLTFGKMREPYVRPGRSLFFDNEIRPEGVSAGYKDSSGLFGSAFGSWLEERPFEGDSMLSWRAGRLEWRALRRDAHGGCRLLRLFGRPGPLAGLRCRARRGVR